MAMQELITNALKYGALSTPEGEVRIAWSIDRSQVPPRLELRWQEVGGPPVTEPARRGFGSRLIQRSLAQDLDGKVELNFARSGVICSVAAPLSPE
jgi:two-component sensor histidine kinase